jgi:large subunit ribosomal protein L13
MNCFLAKAGQVAPQWYVIDASDQVVGRLAAQIAPILMGKHRPTYTPHIDTGDFVIVTNVDKVVFTGKKWEQKVYQRYSGYPGGQKEEAAWKLFERRPERILHEAIRRMMPKNKIGRHMLGKLKLYAGTAHPHQAQQPIPLEPKAGRPAASGIILAPEPVVNPPKRKAKTKRERTAEVAETRAAAREAQAVATATPAADEPQLPAPETSAEAQIPAPEPSTAPEPATPPAAGAQGEGDAGTGPNPA